MSSRPAGRVLLVGWDSADWQLLNPMLDAGLLPALARLIGRGVMGDLATVLPVAPAPLWTSVATGLRADRHGVLDDHESDPHGGPRRPVGSGSRRAKALWSVADQCGLSAHVVNWPASHPAEPVQGVVISDRYTLAETPLDQPWPLAPGAVHPPGLADVLAALRLHPEELAGEDLLPFVPGLARVDSTTDMRPALIARVLAELVSVHAAATSVMESEPWDFVAVRYHALGRLSPHFLPLRAPRLTHVREADHALYRGVLDAFYRLQDMMLERLVEIAGPEATVLLVSGHGVRSDSARAAFAGASAPDLGSRVSLSSWVRSRGVLCIAGPQVRHDELVHGAGLLDVAPTVLTLLGLPVGKDMPGRPLLEVFRSAPTVRTIDSWDTQDGPVVSPWAPEDGAIAAACSAIEQLADLGCLGLGAGEPGRQVDERRHRELSQAFVHLSAAQWQEAAQLLDALHAEEPEDVVLALMLASCHLALGAHEACRALAERTGRHAGRWPVATLLLGMVAAAENRHDEALVHLEQLRHAATPSPLLLFHLGRTLHGLERLEEAEQVFRQAIAIDPGFSPAHLALAYTLLDADRAQEAAEEALTAIGLQYRWPAAHCALGIALARLGRVERASQALETSLAQRPSALAHEWMALIAEQALEEPERAAEHRRLAQALRGERGAEATLPSAVTGL